MLNYSQSSLENMASFKEQLARSEFLSKVERERKTFQSPARVFFAIQTLKSQISSYPQSPIHDIGTTRHVIIKVFANTCRRWQLNNQQQLILLGYRGNDAIGGELLAGHTNELPRDVEDRAGLVIGIGLGLSAIFGNNVEAELSWLNLHRNVLGRKSAKEYMLDGGMVNLFTISEMINRERGI